MTAPDTDVTAPDTNEPQPLLDLHRLMTTIRRRRRFWLSLTLLGFLAGALLPIVLPMPPTAVTTLLVIHEDDPSDPGAIDTDAAVLQTTRIAGAALQRIHDNEPPARFLKQYEAVGLTNNVLKITVRGSSDRQAVARARALADTFIADHVGRMQAAADKEAQELLDQRAQLQAELDKPVSEVQRADIASQIADLNQRVSEARLGDPRVAAGTQIVDQPRLLPRALPKTAAVDAAVGLVAGLTIGITLAAVTGIMRERPVLRREIAEHLGASVIAQLPAPRRGLARWSRRSRAAADRRRVAVTIARAIRTDPGGVSLLELGCPDVTAALALDVAAELAATVEVTVVDDLPDRDVLDAMPRDGTSALRVLDGAGPAATRPVDPAAVRIGVGTITPRVAWTDLDRLGSETLLVVRAGHADAAWLHTVTRQLSDARIPIIGVVLVDPDPRDRSDGTLWDGLHTALRGRTGASGGSRSDDHPATETTRLRPPQPGNARAEVATERMAPVPAAGESGPPASPAGTARWNVRRIEG